MVPALLPQWKALSHETRLRLLELLRTGPLCVGALARTLGVSEAATSQHLRILREAGLVKGEKQGYWTHYALQPEAFEQLALALRQMARRPEPLQVAPMEDACDSSHTDPGSVDSSPGRQSP